MVRQILETDIGYILQTFIGGLRFSRPWEALGKSEMYEIYGCWVRAMLSTGDMQCLVLCDRVDPDLIAAYMLYMDRWMPHGGRGMERVIVWAHTRKPFRGRGLAKAMHAECGKPTRLMFQTKSYRAWRGRGIFSYWASQYDAVQEEKSERERELDKWTRETGARTAELQQAALEALERRKNRERKAEREAESGPPADGRENPSDG